MVTEIVTGLGMMFQLEHIVLVAIGVILGTMLGAVPGLTSTMGIALLLPITFTLSPVAAIAMLTAMYKGGLFGGSISAIMFNAPGTSAAAATAIDGYELAKQGKAGKALRMALIASSVGDMIGCITLILVAWLIAKVALMFGPAEYTAIVLFAFTMVLGVAEKALMKGFLALGAGIFISTVGFDPVSGIPRFEFGSMHLAAGFNLVPVLIGLLAIAEVFRQIEAVYKERKNKTKNADVSEIEYDPDGARITWKEIKGTRKILIRSAGIGTFIGALPGLGPTIAAFMGYRSGSKISKDKNYGKGSIDGVAAPEAANSAVGSANLIPLLSLGIPGDVEAALILGALIIQGIVPGPELFVNNGPIVYGIYAGMMMAILMNFAFNWYFVKWKLATEKPDGYILGNTSLQPITITPHNQTVTYTPEDFRYIGGWGKYLYGIAVKADSPYQTYEDFINASRESPGLTYSDPGPGGITTLAMQMLEKAEGGVTQWKSVPFQGGGEATASLLGGHVDFNINNPGAVASGLQSGSIKLLASVSDSRWEIAPDAPTIRELGYDFDLTSWLAIGGPKGLPDEVVEVWSDVIQKTIADPEFIEAAKKMDLPLDWMPGDEYEDLVINMYDEFGALIEASKN